MESNLVYFVGDPLEVAGIFDINRGQEFKHVVCINYSNYENTTQFEKTQELLDFLMIKQRLTITLELWNSDSKINEKNLLELSEKYFENQLFSGRYTICLNKHSPILQFFSSGSIELWRISHSPCEDLDFIASSNLTVLARIKKRLRSIGLFKKSIYSKEFTWLDVSAGLNRISSHAFSSMIVNRFGFECKLENFSLILSSSDEDYSEESLIRFAKLIKSFAPHVSSCSSVLFKFHPRDIDSINFSRLNDLKVTMKNLARNLGYSKLIFLDEEYRSEFSDLPAEVLVEILKPCKILGPYSSAMIIPIANSKCDIIIDSSDFHLAKKREKAELRHINSNPKVLTV